LVEPTDNIAQVELIAWALLISTKAFNHSDVVIDWTEKWDSWEGLVSVFSVSNLSRAQTKIANCH
jgi:hypothetical protein